MFLTQRGVLFVNAFGDLLDQHPTSFKDTIVWNVKIGRALTGTQVGEAERLRSQIFARMREFMERYEFLIAPVNQVPPFPVDQPYVTEINGVKMDNYLDWMARASAITVTGHPAISVPCGFTPGRPPGRRADRRPLPRRAGPARNSRTPSNSARAPAERRPPLPSSMTAHPSTSSG